MAGLFEKPIYQHGALEAAGYCDAIHTGYSKRDTQPNASASDCHSHSIDANIHSLGNTRDTDCNGDQRYIHAHCLTHPYRYRYAADSHTYSNTHAHRNTRSSACYKHT